MNLTPNQIDVVEDAGMLDGGPVKLVRTTGGFWMAIAKPKGKYKEETVAAGSHPAIVKYQLEKQYPTFQPTLMKSELLIDSTKVKKHSHFLSDDLRKSGHDIYSIQKGNSIEFQITKHNMKVHSIEGTIKDKTLEIKNANFDKQFLAGISGATAEKALEQDIKIKIG